MCLLLARGVLAQSSAATLEDALRRLAGAAQVSFVGEVTKVVLPAAGAGVVGTSRGVVEVTFRVDEAIRGTTDGGTYVVREWAGLWPAGMMRYRVGQRFLMMLHAPGAAGLSSPVGGMAGAMPIRLGGSKRDAAVVDLRWVGATVRRPVVYRESGAMAVAEDVSAASAPAQEASVSLMVTMLKSWEAARHAAR